MQKDSRSGVARHPFPLLWVLTLGLAGTAVMALSISAQMYLSMANHGHSFARILVWQFLGWGMWVLIMPLALAHGAWLAGTPAIRLHPLVIAAATGLAFTTAHILAIAQLTVWLQPYVPQETSTFRDALETQLKWRFVIDLLDYVILLLVGYAAGVYHRARSLEVRESRLEADLAHAQLDALRLEIEPHFLFNTLNSIASLIRDRASDRALAMLLGLSELMRATLDNANRHTTSLAGEVAFVQRYIDLQSVRFSDRLTVTCTVARDAEACLVPTFLLQPLVENAFRHGIARRPGPCRLDLDARVDGDQLVIRVIDDGAGLPPGFRLDSHAGVGLKNARSRIERLFGDEGRLEIGPELGGGTMVCITLPTRSQGVLSMQAAG